jgi:hypothetical protein
MSRTEKTTEIESTELGVVVHAYNPSTQAEDHEFKANLGYIRPYLKTSRKRQTEMCTERQKEKDINT